MIIFLGIAGSGKSVQSKKLAEDLECPYFSIGKFLRNNLDSKKQKDMVNGELIDDKDVINILDDVLNNVIDEKAEFVLDGFPRSILQTDWLIEQFHEERINIRAVFHLHALPEVVVPRLLKRHRPDDHVKAIAKRVEEYNQTIVPIIQRLRANSINVYDIDAEKAIDSIHEDIMEILNFKV